MDIFHETPQPQPPPPPFSAQTGLRFPQQEPESILFNNVGPFPSPLSTLGSLDGEDQHSPPLVPNSEPLLKTFHPSGAQLPDNPPLPFQVPQEPPFQFPPRQPRIEESVRGAGVDPDLLIIAPPAIIDIKDAAGPPAAVNNNGQKAAIRTKIINNAPYPQIVIIPQKSSAAGSSGDEFSINISDKGEMIKLSQGSAASQANVLEQLVKLMDTPEATALPQDQRLAVMAQLMAAVDSSEADEEQEQRLAQLEAAVDRQEAVLKKIGLLVYVYTVCFFSLS